MAANYKVIAKKKDGTIYEGVMTTKEPRLVNGLFAIARLDGSWKYIQPDELSEFEFIPLADDVAKV
ncbi:TPA: hypothetical protein ACSTJY_003313 [Serratia fonticola]